MTLARGSRPAAPRGRRRRDVDHGPWARPPRPHSELSTMSCDARPAADVRGTRSPSSLNSPSRRLPARRRGSRDDQRWSTWSTVENGCPRPRTTSRLGRHRRRRGRHRARRAQDRQGGRRLPGRARGDPDARLARRLMAAKRYRTRRAPLSFHRQPATPRAAADAEHPRHARHGQGHSVRPRGRRRPVGVRPSGRRSARSGRPACRCRTRCRSTAPRS